MTSATFIGLVNNSALLLALALIYDVFFLRQPGQKTSLNQIPMGVIIGLIGLAIMMNPWKFLPGVIFDTRSILLSICGLFFGTVPTLIATMMTGVYRLYLGGTGAWTGFAVILTSGTVGLVWRHWRKKDLDALSNINMYLMGLVTHVLMLLWMFTLPSPVAFSVLSKISLPVILIFPLGTVLLGRLFINRRDRIIAISTVKESEMRYRGIVEDSPGLICRFLPDGEIQYVNKAYCDHFGKKSDELVGKSFLSLLPENEHKRVMDNISSLTVDQPSQTHEHQVIGHEGIIQWQSWTNRAIFDTNGKLKGYQSIGEDITVRKELYSQLLMSESRFREMFSNMNSGVAIYESYDDGKDFVFKDFNPSAEKITRSSKEEVIGRRLLELFPHMQESGFLDALRNVWKTGKSKHLPPFYYKDSIREGWRENRIYRLDSGEIVALFDDVTKRKQNETELNKALEDLLRQKKEISALLKASRGIPLSKTFKDAAQSIFDTSKETIGAKSGYVALLSEDGEENEVLFLDAGGLPCTVAEDLPMPIRGLREVAYRTQKVAYDNDFSQSKWMKYMPLGHVELENVLFAPLNIENQTVGIIGLANKPGGFNDNDLHLAAAFGDLAAVALTYAQSREDLIRSEERLQLAMEFANDGLFDWNLETNEIYYSPGWKRLLGYKDHEIKNEFSEWERLTEPKDVKKSWEMLNEVMEGKRDRFEKEFQMHHKDGHWVDILSRANVLFDEQGKGKRVVGTHVDISERKKAERDLKKSQSNLLQAQRIANLGSWEWDVVSNQSDCSEGFYRLFRLPSDTRDLSFERFLEFIHPGDRRSVKLAVNNALEGKKNYNQIYRVVLQDGSERVHNGQGEVIFNDNGEPIKMIGIQHDVTEQKQLEARLQQAQKMESIGNLAGGIAHDFNNLLFPVVGMSEILLEDLPPDSLEYENAVEIFKAGKRGSDLVKQILAFSRQSEHKMTPTRIQYVLKEVLKLTRSTIPAYIDIKHDIQPDCGMIKADPTQIHQIAMNIITNAYHALEEKGGEINVRLNQVELQESDCFETSLGTGLYARLSVSDTGHGMPSEFIDKIFEPYFTTKEKGKGTGLGLAVVYGIVQEHKGDIKVHSKVGNGTTFDVYLPLMKKSEEPESTERFEGYSGGNERILLVDDEESIASLEKQMLERLGYEVTIRVNSLEALEAFKAKPDAFDLVISDMSMPQKTGDQLAMEMISIRQDIPIIICTGFSERLNQENSLESIGIKGLLMKPVVKSELAKKVRQVLDESKQKISRSLL